MNKTKRFKLIVITLIFFVLIFLIISFGEKEAEENVKEKYEVSTIDTHAKEDYQELEKLEEEYKGYKIDSRLEIPKINLNSYVLEEFSTKSLLASITKYYGKEANKPGNYCIAGHNYGPDNMFQNLKELEIGDKIYLTSKNGIKKEYDIYDIFKVYPNDTKCLSQKTNGNVELTLITCTLDSEKRIIVKAREYEE